MPDELFNGEPFEQIRGQMTLAAERCRVCGYRADEHRWDGACPTCDDDAAYNHEHDQ